jgi:hypothetical protein
MIITLDPINLTNFLVIKAKAREIRERYPKRVLVCILISNHQEFDETERDVVEAIDQWCEKEDNYVRVIQAPLKDLKEDN